jgi:hypothetical protein
MLGSGSLVQSMCDFLQFSFKSVLFSTNFFKLGTILFNIQPFFVFRERFLGLREFSHRKSALSAFWQEGFLFPGLALCNLHFFLQKNLITATTTVTLPVFAVLIAILSAHVLLPGRGCIDNFNWTGFSRQIDTF